MNKIKNTLDDYDHQWIIFAKKKLSPHEKTNAVNTFIALNEGGPFSFVMHKTVIFDIDEMKPIAATDYNSVGKEG